MQTIFIGHMLIQQPLFAAGRVSYIVCKEEEEEESENSRKRSDI